MWGPGAALRTTDSETRFRFWKRHVLGRAALRGLVFGTLFSPHSGAQRTSFFKRNDAEAYVWPKSDTRQAQQKLRSNLAQHN